MKTLLKSKFAAVTAVGLASLLVLTGCGRNGAPLKPSEAAIEQAKKDKQPAPEAPIPNAENPQKRFILDGLLE